MRQNKNSNDDVKTIISFNRATDTRHGDEDSDRDDDIIFAQSPFVHAMLPIMASTRLFGIFFHRPAHSALTSSLPACDMLYCLAVTCLAWINVVFTISSLRQVSGVGPQMLLVLGGVAWQLLIALNATGCFRTSLNSKYRRRFFCGFTKLRLYGGPVYTDPARIKVRVKVTLDSNGLKSWIVIAVVDKIIF